MADYREFHCPYGDDFEGGDECDRCEQYELCMETPAANVVGLDEYEKLKIENNELKIKYADAEKRFCNVMDKSAKLHSKLDKAIEKIFFLRQHKAEYITEDRKICIDSGQVLKILQECIEE